MQQYGVSDNLTVKLAGPFGSADATGKLATLILRSDQWKNGESPFFQTVQIPGISGSSMVEIQADEEQIMQLCDRGTALQIDNDSGVTTAYAIGSKPQEDLTLQVYLTEVVRL